MDLLSVVKAIMPTSIKGWLIYALTLVTTIVGFSTYTVLQTDQAKEYFLKLVDRNELKARFCEEAFESQANELINVLDAQVVIVWVTDLSGFTANKSVLYALDAEHKTKITDGWIGKSSPIYASEQARLDITHLLEGTIVCGKFEIFSDIGRKVTDETGVKYFCSVPVPPTAGHMIGVLTVYFTDEPKMTSALRLEMRKAARGIVYD